MRISDWSSDVCSSDLPLAVYATDRVLSVLEDNAIFNVLNPAFVARRRIRLGESFEPQGQEGEGPGLAVTPLAVPGKVPRYLEDSQAGGGNFGTDTEDPIPLRSEPQRDHRRARRRLIHVPADATPPPHPPA